LHEMLKCECESLVFPVQSKIVEMHFPKDQCCDLLGAIAVAEMCRPGVEEIRTFAGGVPAMTYFKSGGRWRIAAQPIGSKTTSQVATATPTKGARNPGIG
jgi:hypothetical protein